MRATINFEADVDRVQQIMWALAFQEMDPLHQAMDFVETAKPHELHEGVTKALDLIRGVTKQLEQYRDMLASFEKARFETLLPQEAEIPLAVQPGTPVGSLEEVQAAVQNMEQFDQFLRRAAEEEENDNPEEG
jgi:hypothetical protein